MQRPLLLIALFVGVALATWFLLREPPGGDTRDLPVSPKPSWPAPVQRPEHRAAAVPPPETLEGLDPPLSQDEDRAESGKQEELGVIRGRAISLGLAVGTVSVALVPPAGVVTKSAGGSFEVTAVPPGTYRFSLWADGFLAHTEPELVVRGGGTTELEISLLPGIVPRGRVTDEVSHTPVAGAVVDFEGYVRVKSDGSGRFESPFTLPREALDRITVSHPDYDRVTYEKQATLDPSNMVLGMTRGRVTVMGHITNRTGRELPEQARARLYLDRGDGTLQLRREAFFSTGEGFRFARVNEGIYVAQVDFPGTEVPARRRALAVGDTHDVHLEFPLDQGITLEGRLLARALKVQGCKVELLDHQGATVASVHTDREGFFRLEDVEEGTYRLKVWVGRPWFNTEPITVNPKEGFKLVEVDCDLQRLKT